MNLNWQILRGQLRQWFLRLVLYPVCRFLLRLTTPYRALKHRRFLAMEAPTGMLLVFFGRGLGDCTFFSGILEAIRKRFPQTNIRLAILAQMESFFLGNPYIDSVISCPDYEGRGMSGYGRFLGSAMEIAKGGSIDLLLELLPNRDLLPAFWSLLIHKRYSIGIGDPPKQLFYDLPVAIHWQRHFFDALRDAVAPLHIEIAQPSFWFPPEVSLNGLMDREWASVKSIVLAPGGKRNVEAPKDYCWSFEKFTEVVEQLLALGERVILTGADYDRDCLKSLRPHPLLINLIGQTSLPQLLSLVKRCARLVVCNNSALLHLATVLNIPTVSYADPQENITRWGPYGNDGRHLVLQDEKNRKVMPQDFLEAIKKQLASESAPVSHQSPHPFHSGKD